MKSLSESERPYEKCAQFGPSALSDAELLAVLLRSGIKGENALELARRILYYSGDNDGLYGLFSYTPEKLMQVKGIGQVKAILLVCVVELARRLSKVSAGDSPVFVTPASIAEFYMEDMRHEKQEIMKLLLMNTKSKLLGENTISKGTVNASLISPREVLIEALRKEAVNIVLLHNHPSGDPTPSREDIQVTVKIRDAARLCGITLLDHIVIGDNCYYSFSEQEHLLAFE